MSNLNSDYRVFRFSVPVPARLSVIAAVFLFAVFMALPAQAEILAPDNSNGKSVELTEMTDSVFLGTNIYLTPDPEKKLTPAMLLKRYHQKLFGEKQENRFFSVPMNSEGFWLTFMIHNDSPKTNWMLDFGNIVNGRMGFAKNILIVDSTQRRVLTKSENLKMTGISASANYYPENVFLGSAIPLNLKPNTEHFFAIYIEPASRMPFAISPVILKQELFIQTLLNGDIPNILAGLFFMIIMAVFTTFLYMTRDKIYVYYLAYFSALCAIFFLQYQQFVTNALISDSVVIGLLTVSALAALFSVRQHLVIEKSDHPIENTVIFVVGGALVTSMALLLLPGFETIGLWAFLVSFCFTYVCMMVICLVMGHEHKDISWFISSAWLIAFVAHIAVFAAVGGLIRLDSSILHLYWISLWPQAFLLVFSSLRSVKLSEEKKRQKALLQRHNAQSLARLEKSKEAADQARLLRVIERERELMSELREREIQRAEEMRHAKEVADKANQAKSAFLAVVSHEIRTPMTGILGMVQLLRDTSMNKRQSDYVDTISKSGETMMTLLNDILDFEKIERGSMDIENVPFELHRLCEDVVTLMSGHAAQQDLYLKLELDDDVPREVMGDPTRLRQVLLNLVNNGLKFTKIGGVTIKVESGDYEDSDSGDTRALVKFSVIDTGIGISPEAKSKLFMPFTQAETSTSRKYGGTGLGLAISDRLIEGMGGKIQVESVVSEGSSFYFELSMAYADDGVRSETLTSGETSETNVKAMRILVVEDNEMNRKVLKGLLSKNGHEVFLAANGLEAINVCEEEKPELVFMDIQMAGMDGIQTARKIRDNPSEDVAQIPIVALTGNVMMDDIQKFYECGMNGFLAKPIDQQAMNETIANAAMGRFENPLPTKQDDGKSSDGSGVDAKDLEKAGDGANESGEHDSLQNSDISFEKLTKMKTGLELDDRTAFVTEKKTSPPVNRRDDVKIGIDEDTLSSVEQFQAKLQQQNEEDEKKSTDNYGVQMKEKTEEEAKVSKKRAGDIKRNEEEELTEIQKYLMEKSGHSPSTSKADTTEKQDSVEENSDEDIIGADGEDTNSDSPVSEDSLSDNVPVDHIATGSKDDPSYTSEADETVSEKDKILSDNLLDQDMLGGLAETLGKDKFSELLKGFLAKTDEIIVTIHDIIEKQDIIALGAKAHELKGMAGNFGMAEVSRIAGNVEKHSRMSNERDAINNALMLKAANEQTKAAFKDWLQDL